MSLLLFRISVLVRGWKCCKSSFGYERQPEEKFQRSRWQNMYIKWGSHWNCVLLARNWSLCLIKYTWLFSLLFSVNFLHAVIVYTFTAIICREDFWHSKALNYNESIKLNLIYWFTVWVGLSNYFAVCSVVHFTLSLFYCSPYKNEKLQYYFMRQYCAL